MRRVLAVVLTVLVVVGLAPTAAVWGSQDHYGAVPLVRDGQVDGVAVYWSGEASPTPQFAAAELRDCVEATSGAVLPVVEVTLRGRRPAGWRW